MELITKKKKKKKKKILTEIRREKQIISIKINKKLLHHRATGQETEVGLTTRREKRQKFNLFCICYEMQVYIYKEPWDVQMGSLDVMLNLVS